MDLQNANDKIDPELREFIVNEQIKTQIRAQIRRLNNICFDKCIEKPGSKFEAKQENCVQNCIGRYLDTNGFIGTRFSKRASGGANVSSDSFA